MGATGRFVGVRRGAEPAGSERVPRLEGDPFGAVLLGLVAAAKAEERHIDAANSAVHRERWHEQCTAPMSFDELQ